MNTSSEMRIRPNILALAIRKVHVEIIGSIQGKPSSAAQRLETAPSAERPEIRHFKRS